MPTLKTAFRTLLTADPALGTILTGGIHDAATLPNEGYTPGNPPPATLQPDGVRVRPFAVVRWDGSRPTVPDLLAAEVRVVSIYLYETAGYDHIEAARARLKALLHITPLVADNVGLAWSRWRDDLGELTAPEYGYIPFSRTRFTLTITRK